MRCKAAREGIAGSERASEGLHVSAVVRKYKVENHSDAAPATLIVTGQRLLDDGAVKRFWLCTLLFSSPLSARSLVLVFGSRIKTRKKKRVDKKLV